MNAFAVPIPFPRHKLDSAFRGMTCQHYVTEVGKNTIIAFQAIDLKLRCAFQYCHVLRSQFCDVDYFLKLCLYAIVLYIPLVIQNAACAGDAAKIIAIPTDREMMVFDLPGVKALTSQPNSSFFKVSELCHVIAIVH